MRLVTTTTPVQDIKIGMTIVEYGLGSKPKRIEIKEVEHAACSSRDTHVNKNLCYSKHATVEILVGKEKSPDEMNPKELAAHMGIPEEHLFGTPVTTPDIQEFFSEMGKALGVR